MKKTIDVKFLHKIANVIQDNASTLTMGAGILSLGIALWSAFKASDEVSKVNEDYDEKVREINSRPVSDDEKAKELKEVKSMRNIRYIYAEKWTLLFGGISTGMVFLTKYLDGLAISGLTALAIAKQEELKSFAENTKKFLSEEDLTKLEDLNLEDKIMRNFVDENGEPRVLKIQNMAKNGAGELFVDTQDGVIFQMKREELIACLDWAEDYCMRNGSITKEKYYEHLGILWNGKHCEYWGPENRFDAYIGQRTLDCGWTVSTVEHRKNPRLKA